MKKLLLVISVLFSVQHAYASAAIVCQSIYLETFRGGKARLASQVTIPVEQIRGTHWEHSAQLRDLVRTYDIVIGEGARQAYFYVFSRALDTGEVQIHHTFNVGFGPPFYFDVIFPGSVTIEGTKYSALELECKPR